MDDEYFIQGKFTPLFAYGHRVMPEYLAKEGFMQKYLAAPLIEANKVWFMAGATNSMITSDNLFSVIITFFFLDSFFPFLLTAIFIPHYFQSPITEPQVIIINQLMIPASLFN